MILLALAASMVVVPVSAWATDGGASLYNQGNGFYRQGHYGEAARTYEAAIAAGLRHSDVFYNLGNAYYKSGSPGRAVLAYERGLRLSPSDPDLLANLAFVNDRLVDRIQPGEDPGLLGMVRLIYRSLDPDELSIVGAVALWALCGLGVCLVAGWGRPVVLFPVGAVVAVFLCATAALVGRKIADRSSTEAIILASEAIGRSGPGLDYLPIFTLHEGAKVSVDRTEGGWVLVRLPNGLGGWAPDSTLSRI